MVVADEAEVGWYKGTLRGGGRHVSSSKAPLAMVCQGGSNEGRGEGRLKENRCMGGISFLRPEAAKWLGAVGETSGFRGEPMGGQLGQGHKFDVIGNTKC